MERLEEMHQVLSSAVPGWLHWQGEQGKSLWLSGQSHQWSMVQSSGCWATVVGGEFRFFKDEVRRLAGKPPCLGMVKNWGGICSSFQHHATALQGLAKSKGKVPGSRL